MNVPKSVGATLSPVEGLQRRNKEKRIMYLAEVLLLNFVASHTASFGNLLNI